MGKPVRGKTKEFTVRLLGLRMSNLRDDRKASSIKSKASLDNVHPYLSRLC